jgi:AcrR family transcriptional regulator
MGELETEARRPGRRPGPTETREAILRAARGLFAEKGYDRASVRAIARTAGVDPALVHHFYGTKEGLFIAAMEVPLNPPEMLPKILLGPREELGKRLVRTFFEIWDDPKSRLQLIAIIRSAFTSEQGAAMLREFVRSALLGRISVALDLPKLRVTAAAGQLIGVAVLRYVLEIEPVHSADVGDLVDLLAPTIQRYLTEEP